MFVPDAVQTSPDLNWYTAITANMPVMQLRNELRPAMLVDSFVYNPNGLVYNSSQMSLTLPPASLMKANGTAPSGYLVRESQVLRKKGEWIAAGLSTESENRLLISGGIVNMHLKNGGSELSVAPGVTLKIRYSMSSVPGNMNLYNGQETGAGFLFGLNPDTGNNNVAVTQGGYEITTTRIKSLLSAYVFDTTGIPQTKIRVSLPEHYTNANTQVFISFDNLSSVQQLPADVNAKKFLSGDLSVNRPITIIVLSKQAGDYYMDHRQTMTALPTSGIGSSDVQMMPTRTSLSAIKAYLDLL